MRSLKIILLSLILILVSACTDSGLPSDQILTTDESEPPSKLIEVRAVSSVARMYRNNSLIFEISGTVSNFGHVFVEYWFDQSYKLRSSLVESSSNRFSIFVSRLRPNTSYQFQVFGTDSDGNVFPGTVGEFMTGNLPIGLQNASFNVSHGSSTHDLTYLEFRQEAFRGFVAIDNAGYVVWYYSALPNEEPYVMAQRSNGNIVYLAGGKRVVAHGLVEINPLGEELSRLPDICPPVGPMHHEVTILKDGRVMYLSREVLRPGFGEPPVPQEGDTIGIWDSESGSNDIVWKLFDYISPAHRVLPDSDSTLPDQFMWGGCDRDPAVQDWSHGNSVNEAVGGTIILSLRHLDQIIAIDEDFQSVKWRLGGPGSDFNFPDKKDKFYHQHAASLLPNGNVLLFDNGNGRPKSEGGEYSRALELKLDFDSMTARKSWEFRKQPDIFSDCCSIVNRLENGNSLILFGINSSPVCCRSFTIIEATQSGEIVWSVDHRSPGKFSQYRIYPSDSIMGEFKVTKE